MIVKGKLVVSALLGCAALGAALHFKPAPYRGEVPTRQTEVSLIHSLSALWLKAAFLTNEPHHDVAIEHFLTSRESQKILGGWLISSVSTKNGDTHIRLSPPEYARQKTFADYIDCPPGIKLGYCPPQYFYEGEPLVSVSSDIWRSKFKGRVLFVGDDVIISHRENSDLLTLIEKSVF